jgi:DNA invertase Pin-like site-specific DNA recombinase
MATGRPSGRPRRHVELAHVHQLRLQGLSLRQICRNTGLGYGTVRRALTRVAASAELSQNPSAASLCVPSACPKGQPLG